MCLFFCCGGGCVLNKEAFSRMITYAAQECNYSLLKLIFDGKYVRHSTDNETDFGLDNRYFSKLGTGSQWCVAENQRASRGYVVETDTGPNFNALFWCLHTPYYNFMKPNDRLQHLNNLEQKWKDEYSIDSFDKENKRKPNSYCKRCKVEIITKNNYENCDNYKCFTLLCREYLKMKRSITTATTTTTTRNDGSTSDSNEMKNNSDNNDKKDEFLFSSNRELNSLFIALFQHHKQHYIKYLIEENLCKDYSIAVLRAGFLLDYETLELILNNSNNKRKPNVDNVNLMFRDVVRMTQTRRDGSGRLDFNCATCGLDGCSNISPNSIQMNESRMKQHSTAIMCSVNYDSQYLQIYYDQMNTSPLEWDGTTKTMNKNVSTNREIINRFKMLDERGWKCFKILIEQANTTVGTSIERACLEFSSNEWRRVEKNLQQQQARQVAITDYKFGYYQSQKEKIVGFLIENYVKYMDKFNINSTNMLQAICYCSNYDLLKVLLEIENDVKPININNTGCKIPSNTQLWDIYGNTIAQSFIRKLISVEVNEALFWCICSPYGLYSAKTDIENENFKCFQLLVNRKDLKPRSVKAILQECMLCKKDDFIEYLIENNDKFEHGINFIKELFDIHAIHFAAYLANVKLLKLFLQLFGKNEKFSFDINSVESVEQVSDNGNRYDYVKTKTYNRYNSYSSYYGRNPFGKDYASVVGTPLILCGTSPSKSTKNKIECIKLLLSQSDIDLTIDVKPNGWNALFYAVSSKNTEIADCLIEYANKNLASSNFFDKTDKNGNNCLHIACANVNFQMLKLVLNCKRFDKLINSKDNTGKTPLMKMIVNVPALDLSWYGTGGTSSLLKPVQLLLFHNYKPNDISLTIKDNYGKNVMDHCLEKGELHIARYLIKNSIKHNWDLIEIKGDNDNDGNDDNDDNDEKNNSKKSKEDKIATVVKEWYKKIAIREGAIHASIVPTCFSGNATIKMADGTRKYAKDIVIGDKVLSFPNIISTVTCTVESIINRDIFMCNLSKTVEKSRQDNTWITFEHPILMENRNGIFDIGITDEMKQGIQHVDAKSVNKFGLSWYLPKHVKQVELVYQEKIFNFMVNKGHSMNVNNHWCCTLGHDLKGNVIEHQLWGNKKNITQYLKQRSFTGFPRVTINEQL